MKKPLLVCYVDEFVIPSSHGFIKFRSKEDFLKLFDLDKMKEDDEIILNIFQGVAYNMSTDRTLAFPWDGDEKK